MTNKTTEKLFTEDFLQDLIFLIDNFNVQEHYEESIVSTATFDDPYGYDCDEELEEMAFKYEYLYPYMKETINNYFNIDFDRLGDFIDENYNTKSCDLEAKFNEYLQDYLD